MGARISGAMTAGWTALLLLSSTLAWGQSDESPVASPSSSLATPAAPVTLGEAVSRALAKNPTYATARLEVLRAEAVVRETRAAWLPTVYGYGSITHLDGDRVQAGNVILAQTELAASVVVTVPLVMTRQWLTTGESRLSADATRATSDDARRVIAYATGQAYLAVYAQKLVIEVDERARDTARKHADYAHQRYAGGVGNSLDEVRAIQETSTDDALVQAAYAQLASAEEALGIMVGAEGPLDTENEPALAAPPDIHEGLDSAGRRTDVVAFDLRRRAATKTAEDDWSDYAPYLVGVAEPFYESPATPTVPRTGYQLEVLLTVPIYDGGLRYGRHDEHAALRDEARVAYEAGLRQARADVRTAFEGMLRSDAALRSSRDAAKFAAQALDLANLAYRAGAATNIEVIDAEREARDAATQAEIAADTARQARLAMLTATNQFP
jgi:outer membrane protein TolC